MVVGFAVARRAVPALIVALCCSASISSAGDKLTQDDKQWLSDVKVLLLPSEEKAFHDIKAKDRAELRTLFWARRNPKGPGAASNPFREAFEKALAEAETRFAQKKGAATDCGQLFLLLGEPDEIQPAPMDAAPEVPMGVGADRPSLMGGAAPVDTFGASSWKPTTQWVYSTLEGVQSDSGELKVLFDDHCETNETMRRAIRAFIQPRAAEARVVNPWVEVKLDDKGRLVPLQEYLPKPGPAQVLLETPRQDFPIAQQLMFMRSGSGGTALLGALQGKLSDVPAGKPVKMVVRVEALTSDGDVSAFNERETSVTPASDGSFLVGFGLAARPGTFTLRAGVVQADGGQGSAVSRAVEVPGFAAGKFQHSTLAFLRSIEEVSQPDKNGPLEPFVMGPYRLVPRVGDTFAKSESMAVFCHYYGAQVDPATGKASVTGSLGVFKNKKLQFNRAEQHLNLADGALVYGPVPFETFAPGTYEAELKITDNVAKQDLVVQGTFEVTP